VNEDPNQWPSDIPAELLVYMAAERGLSWNYLRLTQRSLMLFSNWLSKLHPGRAPDAVTIDHITEYLAMERRRGLAPASIKTLIAALKLFFPSSGKGVSPGAIRPRPCDSLKSV
jgi:site-specific recombinase XerD